MKYILDFIRKHNISPKKTMRELLLESGEDADLTEEQIQRMNEKYGQDSFMSQVKFEHLPQDIEDILIGVKEKFPSWYINIASDPHFFTITSPDGRDFWEYASQRKQYWDAKYLESWKLLSAMHEQSAKYKKALEEKDISFEGVISNENMFEQLLDGTYREYDPIFYTELEHTYHKTKYDMAIIWAQYGESPNEQVAIQYLQGLQPEDFEGVSKL